LCPVFPVVTTFNDTRLDTLCCPDRGLRLKADFGPWNDPDGAVRKYQEQRQDLQAERTPRTSGEDVTFRDMAIGSSARISISLKQGKSPRGLSSLSTTLDWG
jgi:hypothetical protein